MQGASPTDLLTLSAVSPLDRGSTAEWNRDVMKTTLLTPPVLDPDDVPRAIGTVAEIVEKGAAAAEAQRTLPRATVDALTGAGLLSLRVPRALGGSEVDPLVALAAYEEMTAHDTSAGWAMAIANGGAALAGARLPDDGAAEVFAGGIPRFAGTFAPTGTAAHVDDGYRVTGRWSFASGIHHADWLTAGCRVAAESGPPELLTVVMSQRDAVVIDNWHVAGLQGTGSCDWEAADVYVPFERTMGMAAAPVRGGPSFSLPLFAFLAPEHAGFALGCGRRSLIELMQAAGDTVRLLASRSLASRSAFQRDLGRAEAELRSARLLIVDVLGTASDAVWRGDSVTPLLEAEVRMAAAHVTDVAVRICTLAFRSLGARALHLANPVQRNFRDMHAAAQHVFVADTTFEDVARIRLGLPATASGGFATDST